MSACEALTGRICNACLCNVEVPGWVSNCRLGPSIGDRVLTPSGRVGTVTGVKMVWVQLDQVASSVYCDVEALLPAPKGSES